MNLTIEWETVDDDFVDVVHQLPAKWEVCHDCRGEGKYPDRSFSPFGDGVYTSSEFYEAYDTPDEREEYFDGKYDVECETCCGRTTVLEVDWDRLRQDNLKLATEYEEHLNEEAAYRQMCAAERAMGC